MEIKPAGIAPIVRSPEISKTNKSGNGEFAQKLKVEDARAKTAEDAKLRAACRDLEAVFLNLMWSKMRETVPKDSLMGENSQEDIMHSMLDSEMTKNMAAAGGVGLADLLYRQLSQKSAEKTDRASK